MTSQYCEGAPPSVKIALIEGEAKAIEVYFTRTQVGLTNEQGAYFGGAIAQEVSDARQRRLAFNGLVQN